MLCVKLVPLLHDSLPTSVSQCQRVSHTVKSLLTISKASYFLAFHFPTTFVNSQSPHSPVHQPHSSPKDPDVKEDAVMRFEMEDNANHQETFVGVVFFFQRQPNILPCRDTSNLRPFRRVGGRNGWEQEIGSSFSHCQPPQK